PAADRRPDRAGRPAAPRARLDGPPHLAGTGTRNVHHSERRGDHAPTGGDSRSGTAGDSQDAERRRADRCRASAARPSVRPIAAFRRGRGRRGRRGWRGCERLAGRIWKQLYRVRAPRRQRHRGADQDGPVRSGLRRGHGRRGREGHRARLAERVAGPVAAAIPPALPERHRRGTAGLAAARVAARGGGAMTTRTAHRLAVGATLLVAIASCPTATPAPGYATVP